MRRIPRPSRAIDPAAAFQLPVRQRISPASCRALAVAGTQSSTTAAFSTSSPRPFLLSGKQDKKKHQQFVRRWQKRLLGDSEPIGAHVDPYDPTSPVRIAPEEQGEYEEVLDEHEGSKDVSLSYVPAEHLYGDRPGNGLKKVGGTRWNQNRREMELAADFERFTQRTYTPLTLNMADRIEELTGTPYTLRNENLYMAQAVHEVTGRPYTRHNFGLHSRVTDPAKIRKCFEQAVTEVYTLKEVGLELDLSKAPNQGVYNRPRWAKDIEIQVTGSGELALAFPKYKSAADFVKIIQETPEWEASEELAEEEILLEEELVEPVLPQESAPTMDPDTPPFKRAAVVKADPSKKPFDFMSNRPTPRTNPVHEVKVEEPAKPVAVPAETTNVSVPAPPAVDFSKLESSITASASTLQELRKAVLQQKQQSVASQLAKASIETSSESSQAGTVSWRRVSITDPTLKFALFKRLYQLTGLHISDPHLTQANTLGDLYSHLLDAAKPQPRKLFNTIIIEGQKAREKAKKQGAVQTQARQKADLGDLITLGNVEIREKKARKREQHKKIGLSKVINYALRERNLAKPQRPKRGISPAHQLGLADGFKGVREGSREVPKYGEPVPSAVSDWLEKKTRKRIEAHIDQ